MKQVLLRLFDHKAMSREAAREVLLYLAKGKCSPSEMAAFLTVFMMRNITVGEMEGFRDAMLELCISPDLGDYPLIDLCGTGGDGKDTFNISTLASFVVAGAGYKVAKHGNFGVSSICGSSNIMAHFGYTFTHESDYLKRNIEEAGICFLHAPVFHPAMAHMAPIRKELGFKTFFNMLGPMVNPARPAYQMVGVFNLELLRLYAYLYQQTNKNFVIIHSLDGYDEISLTGPFKIVTPRGERIMKPEDLGLHTHAPEDLAGGKTVAESAAIFYKILEGNGTPAQREAVIANAGMAIHCADPKLALPETMQVALESLEAGKAMAAFKKLLSK